MVGTPTVSDSSDSSDGELSEITSGDGDDDDNTGDTDGHGHAAPAPVPAPVLGKGDGNVVAANDPRPAAGHSGRSVLLLLISQLGVGYVGLLLMLYAAQRMLLFPAPANPVRCDAGDNHVVILPEAGRPDGVSASGVSLLEYRAMTEAPDGKREGVATADPVTVVFFHANADQNGWGACRIGAFLATRGINFVSVEYPGYGLDADGADDDAAPYPSEAGIMFTAKEVLKQLGRPNAIGDTATHRVILMGQSLGTAVAVGLAADPEVRKTSPNVEGALLISPFLSVPKAATSAFPFVPLAALELLVKDPFDSEAKAAALVAAPAPPALDTTFAGQAPAPFRWLVMHGTEDEIVPFGHGKQLAATLKAAGGHDVVFKALNGAGHNNIFSRDWGMKVFGLIERFAFATTASA